MRFPGDVPVLTSGDVTLRAHRLEDAAGVVEQCTDALSIRWTSVPLDYDHEMAVDFLTRGVPAGWTDGGVYHFAIESTHPDGQRRFSGSISLRDRGHNRAEIAFGAHPAARGRGVMTAAVNLLLDYGFKTVGLETVIWYAEKGNFASRRIAWKSGFTFAGTLDRWHAQRGVYRDSWVATLHRSDSRVPKTTWYAVPTIVGQHIRLRALHETDTTRIAEACGDATTQHWLALMPRGYTEDDAREYLGVVEDGLAAGRWVQWAVADPDTDRLLGHVGIPRMTRDAGEIGYWMHPDARGRGVMTEAVGMVIRHAFTDVDDGGLGMRRLTLVAARGNDPSRRIAIANAFTEFGVEHESLLLGDGSYADHVLYELLRSEWIEGQA